MLPCFHRSMVPFYILANLIKLFVCYYLIMYLQLMDSSPQKLCTVDPTVLSDSEDYDITTSEDYLLTQTLTGSICTGQSASVSERGSTSSEGSASDTSTSGSTQPWTREQKLTAITMALMNFSTQVSFAVIAPFYPNEAAKKGATSTEIGLIFGIFQLIIFITSPIYGQSVS